MNETKTNEKLNNKTPATIPSHFWRNPIKWRTTNTGMNQNVINTYSPNCNKTKIIQHIREYTVPYSDGRKCLKHSGKKHDYFIDVVNDCMRNIWLGKRGFVFTESQLEEVIKIHPSVSVRWDKYDECYWCLR